MEDLGYGREYKYGHAFDHHFVKQDYLPEGLKSRLYYRPSEEGEEKRIGDRLRTWWKGRRQKG
jgi:putative ATPase